MGPFGTTIAHGFLTLSLLPAFFETAFEIAGTRMGINYGLNRVRFTDVVPVGSRLRARFTLKTYEPIDDGAQMVVEAAIEREGSAKPVCVAESVTRRYIRSFVGLLADRTQKVATVQEINAATAQGWAGRK